MKGYQLVAACLIESALLCGEFSVSAQTNVQLLSTRLGNFGPLAISGNYLVMAGSGYPPAPALRIFEISDPAHPVDLGYQDGGGELRGIALSGSRAYIGAYYVVGGGYDFGLRILDVSNPTNPVIVGNIPGVQTDAIAVSGSRAYLMQNEAVFPDLGVKIYDISNPATPSYLGFAAINDYGSPSVVWLSVRDSNLFAVGFYGLYVIDVTDPVTPIRLASCSGAGALGASGAALQGNSVCVADYTNGLWIADVSCPTNPVIVYHRYWSYPMSGNFHGVAASGNYAYVGGDGVWVFDISNPTNATLVATNFDYAASGYWLAISKQHLFASNPYGFSIYSLGSAPFPSLAIHMSSTNTVLLSWPTPSPAFAVQQNPDLDPANWHTLASIPVVVAGRNQVVVTKPAGQMFYRLMSQ